MKTHEEIQGGDFWNGDPHLEKIYSKLEAEEACRVYRESEAIADELDRQFEQIETKPLRHHKKY